MSLMRGARGRLNRVEEVELHLLLETLGLQVEAREEEVEVVAKRSSIGELKECRAIVLGPLMRIE